MERPELTTELSKRAIQLALAEVHCFESLYALDHRSVHAAETRRLIDSLGRIVQDNSVNVRVVDEPNSLVVEAVLELLLVAHKQARIRQRNRVATEKHFPAVNFLIGREVKLREQLGILLSHVVNESYVLQPSLPIDDGLVATSRRIILSPAAFVVPGL